MLSEVIDVTIAHGDVTSVDLGPGISFVDYNWDGWDDISISSSGTRHFQFLKNIGASLLIGPLPIASNNHQAR